MIETLKEFHGDEQTLPNKKQTALISAQMLLETGWRKSVLIK